MKCNEIEKLMPRYVEGDLSEAERRSVESHLASCTACHECLEAFTALEQSLVGLKTAVPRWKTVEARFLREAGFGRRQSIPRLIFTTPVMAGLSFVALGFAFIFRGNTILSALQGLLSRFAFSLSNLERVGTNWLAAFAGVDFAMLIGIYGLTLIAILAGTGLLAMRFARK
jgi:predicted anti-sigma-YlaC factor YlaD